MNETESAATPEANPENFKSLPGQNENDLGTKRHSFVINSVGTNNNVDLKKEVVKYKHVTPAHKFGFLVWKNVQILKRHKLQTCLEILLPVLFVCTILVVRVLIKARITTEKKLVETKLFHLYVPAQVQQTILDSSRFYLNKQTITLIYFSPNTTVATQIMNTVQSNYLAYGTAVAYQIQGFPTETELVAAYSDSRGNVLGGIVFEKISESITQYKIRLPAAQKYVDPGSLLIFEVARWHTQDVYPNPQLRGPRQPDEAMGGTPGYFHEGFMLLQYAVDASIIKFFNPSTNLLEEDHVGGFDIHMRKFSYPSFSDDRFLPLYIQIFQIVITLSFILAVNNIVKYVVVEKEKRLAEAMKLMGLGPYLHWSAWFVNHFFLLILTDVLMVFVFKVEVQKYSNVIFNADSSVLFVFLLAYISSVITFAFFLSTLFSRVNAAVMTSWIIFCLTYLPFVLLAPFYESMGLAAKLVSMLLLNTAMAHGFQIILVLDGFGPFGEGSHWSNIHSSAGANDTLSLFHVIVMLFVDAVIYMLLAIYIEAVFPGELGIPRPCYFLFQKSYWCGPTPRNKSKADVTQQDPLQGVNYDANPHYEKPLENWKAGIKIRNLTKQFGSKTAVNNLNIDIFENQITVLLGHNGAGKTTTMSMLTGLFPPTSGTGVFTNVDMRENMEHIQQNLRLCPQKDVLFDELTCEQHLNLYCWVKGCVSVKGEVDAMLLALNLEPKRHTVAGLLSGGMKRKLLVGLAFIGGAPIVILDEPTAGMDPAARRVAWDLIASQKKNRTIILSTHFMDEADLLGDRIAVMANGELEAVGTPLFLKKMYGEGYQLVIVKKVGCNVSSISQLLGRHLGGDVEIANNVGAELRYTLPKEKSPLFPNMFDELEERRVELMIDSYGATATTMEEVFMRITKRDCKRNPLSAPLKTVPDSETMVSSNVVISYAQVQAVHNDIFTTQYTFNNGWRIQCQQFRACLIKKWLYLRRSWAIIFIQVFPMVLTLMVYTAFKTSSHSEINLKLSLDQFEDTVTPVLCLNRSDGLCDAYERYAKPHTSVIQAKIPKMTKPDFDMHRYILAESKKSLSYVNSRFIIALEQVAHIHRNVTQFLYAAHYNNQPYHAQPVALNFLMNAVLRVRTGDDKKEIVIYNHPLPISDYDRALSRKSAEIVIFVSGMVFILSISFVVSSFCIFLIQERAGKAKHLQCVSGLEVTTYWVSNFVFDFINYLVTVALLMAVIVTFALDPYSENEVYVGIFLLLSAFGCAAIPIVYISSFMFNLSATGFTLLAVVSIFTGMGPYFIMVVVRIPALEAHKLAQRLESIFLFFPSFAMGYGIFELGSNQNLHLECPALFVVVPETLFCARNHANSEAPHPCCEFDNKYLAWHSYGIGRNLVHLFSTGLVAILVLILIEAKLFKKLRDLRPCLRHNVDRVNESPKEQVEDGDVKAERDRVETNEKQLLTSENLVMRNLTKYFGTFKAVDNLSLGIEKGECFGLLGVNGAGKTTTFRILTGDLTPSSGDAFIVGRSIRTKKSIYQNVGYCPQFDALINKLTGREMIQLFARFRGIHEIEINNVADRLGLALAFSEFLDKPVFAYSGGNQRKLSTAIALVGNPPLVFLDEPSTGMDPVARRHLWDCLSKVQESGASLVLTSHSMEECEALCSRLAIMVKGRFRCLGSIQHLKSKFSEGFTVTAQIQPKTPTIKENDQLHDTSNSVLEQRKSSAPGHIPFEWETDLKPLQEFIEASFPDSVLKDVHAGYVHYQVRSPNISWGYLFQKMEEAKILFELEDYSVGQTSMDQIFLMFGGSQDSDK